MDRAHADDRDSLFAALYVTHRTSLVRLAAFLVVDSSTAEDIVQEAYISCYRARWRVRDTHSALAYLRRAVVNTARSTLRRRLVAARHTARHVPEAPSAEASAYQSWERDRVVAGLKTLAPRQREALVLSYWGELTDVETAAAMGCSVGSVKAYKSRGLATLGAVLGEELT